MKNGIRKIFDWHFYDLNAASDFFYLVRLSRFLSFITENIAVPQLKEMMNVDLVTMVREANTLR